jgi:hypothetical protein
MVQADGTASYPARAAGGVFVTSSRPGASRPVPDVAKHVIDEYKHRLQQVTCVCGWQGSSASPDGISSDWKAHLASTRPPGASRR